jgi:ribonucleoside-diphosphate reductase alpha chain
MMKEFQERQRLYRTIDEEEDSLVDTMPQVYLRNDLDSSQEYVGGYEALRERLSSTYDFEGLEATAGHLVRNLNQIIDHNYYPIPETRTSNTRHRPIGIGVQGLANVFLEMGYPFDSKEARQLNQEIFETIYYGAMKMSHQMAVESEPYESFQGSPLSEGQFQFDMWDKGYSMTTGRYDWVTLRTAIMNDGARNSLLVAPMPTASTAQILGNYECFEPILSNVYTRRVLAGEYMVMNDYLVRDLQSLGLWSKEIKDEIVKCDGSVQTLAIPKHLKELYKTVWEMKQKAILDMAIDRGHFICQSQSLNLFLESPDISTLTSMHFYGWKSGLKTGVYYLRSRPSSKAIQFSLDADKKTTSTVTQEPDPPCESCSG